MHFKRSYPSLLFLIAGTTASFTIAAASNMVRADIEPHASMLRYPDVSKDKIVFSYANDLWIVDRNGGQAVPLASPPGAESLPKFSADGNTIAFTGNYDGGTDIYTIPTTGGMLVRVTHHPAGERLCAWTPDNKLLFWAYGLQGIPTSMQMFTVGVEGGMPVSLPIAFGSFGEINETGEWLAFTPNTRDTRTWKRYRGGLATDIWLFNLNTLESKKVTDWEGTDTLPMWLGSKVYYLSDNGPEMKLNIWVYDVKKDTNEQITHFAEYDVKWPSMGPGKNGKGEIIFQYGPELRLLDLNNNKSKAVEVTIPGDVPLLRTQRIDASEFIQGGSISPSGKRLVADARGDAWSIPAENGIARNLSLSNGSAERGSAWSPDGRWISYFSDKTGEYELYITQSDGKGETKQLTFNTKSFYTDTFWSPDSKKIVFTDKDAKIYLLDIESGETKQIDKDPYAEQPDINWSHDSQWITYARTQDSSPFTVIWLYNVNTDEHHQLTSGMFPDTSPTFDRKGDYLYFASQRTFNPTYEDFGGTWIYQESGVLLAVPLRKDVKAPWPFENDEEEWKADEDKDKDKGKGKDADADENAEEGKGDAGEDKNADTDKDDKNNKDQPAAISDHPLYGVWEGTVNGIGAMISQLLPPDAGVEVPDNAPYKMEIFVDEDGNISGTSTVEIMGESQTDELGDVTFDEATGEYTEITEEDGVKSVMKGKLEGNTLSGTWEVTGVMNGSGTWSVTKTDEEVEEPEEEAAEVVEIEFEGFEARAIQLPVDSGNFSNLAVNDKNQLLYVRAGDGIKLFDISDKEPAEKSVVGAANGFAISADGKKLVYYSPAGFMIANASASATGKAAKTSGMIVNINPREEWKEVFRDAWRIQRDWFYADNMHGLDWDKIYEQYAAMIEFCNSRDDVSYVIGEMIGELNCGHAYYFGGGTDRAPTIPVGLLGVDFELENGSYKIAKIHTGAPWDADARGPIIGKAVDIKEGDYLLAVNGVPVDGTIDPWAPFIGLADQMTILTVNDVPEINDEAREVMIKPVGSDDSLRFRSWIESNRAYVEKQSDGKVGYIYVPDTGVRGQSELFRQFVGQFNKEALIIDERWNGGGQLPNRFIELLNRPVTNYFAIRDGKPMKVPMFSHNGPKCMLINGNAGSGGDMFPWLFREAKLGKLIGTRTWGGLVGISGNPPLIDGGYMSVPRFAFYEKDGTWGVEGHGVDPDIEVIDDPTKRALGQDVQLEVAIEQMLKEIKENPYIPVAPPKPPVRTGIGILEKDK